MAVYVKIGDNINSDLVIEIPSEKDQTMLVSSISAQFPGSVGLRFKSEAGAWRGCRVEGNIIAPPADGWGSATYYVVRQAPKRSAAKEANGAPKRKTREEDDDEDDESHPFLEKYHIPDLMMADLPFSAEDDEIKEYFEEFGPLEDFKIMTNDSGKSRGFGFIKYKTTKATKAALDKQHFIHNRPVDLRFTKNSLQMLQMGYGVECMPNDNIETKLFIGRLPIGTTSGELTEVFKKYGPLKDVYIPQNAKSYGFVTFGSVAKAFRAMNTTHMVKGQYINVTMANQKQKPSTTTGNATDGNTDNNTTDDGTKGMNMNKNMNQMNMRMMNNMMGNMMGMGMMGMNNNNTPQQMRANNMAQVLLDGMSRMTQQQKQFGRSDDMGTNNTQFNYNNNPGFQGAYGGTPGAGAIAGALGVGGMGNDSFRGGYQWNGRGKQ